MDQLIGFDVHRTENINIDKTIYTIRFTTRQDGQEHKLFVSNESNKKQASYTFTEETANDFKRYRGRELQAEVFSIIESDISAGII